jgi:hypothetical protein
MVPSAELAFRTTIKQAIVMIFFFAIFTPHYHYHTNDTPYTKI